MKEPKSLQKPKQTQSLLSKLFGKKSSPKKSDKETPHCSNDGKYSTRCDENANSKSKSPKPEKSDKTERVSSKAKGKRKKRIRIRFFRRKKDESPNTSIPGTPIYVELSPSKSPDIPDLISNEICQHDQSLRMQKRNLTRSSSVQSETVIQEDISKQPKTPEKSCADVQLSKRRPESEYSESTPVKKTQSVADAKNETRSVPITWHDVKRTHSFGSKSCRTSLQSRTKKSKSTEDDDDVSPTAYAKLCRKSNRMIQNVQESSPSKRKDRTFLRWNSVSDLQYQALREKSIAISKQSSTPSNRDKSISLQDLSTKQQANKDPTPKPVALASSDIKSQVEADGQPSATTLSKVRPSFDKALSKSEYDLRHVRASSSNRGILAFKKVCLPDVPTVRTRVRPTSAIIPGTYSMATRNHQIKTAHIQEGYEGAATRLRPQLPTPPYPHYSRGNSADYRSLQCQKQDPNASYSSDKGCQPDETSNRTLVRTHSFQDRYSPPLLRRAYHSDLTRPKSCFQPDLSSYPPFANVNEASYSESNCRRGAAVSRSRSRARSIARRFNMCGSTENISPTKFAICRSNNWNSTDLDATDEYCTMKPLHPDSFVIPSESVPTASYIDVTHRYETRGRVATGRLPMHASYCYENMTEAPYAEPIIFDGRYRQPCVDTNSKRQKLFYALDV